MKFSEFLAKNEQKTVIKPPVIPLSDKELRVYNQFVHLFVSLTMMFFIAKFFPLMFAIMSAKTLATHAFVQF